MSEGQHLEGAAQEGLLSLELAVLNDATLPAALREPSEQAEAQQQLQPQQHDPGLQSLAEASSSELRGVPPAPEPAGPSGPAEVAAAAGKLRKRQRSQSDWVRAAFFRKDGATGNQATCSHCNQDLSTLNVSRMKTHLLNLRVCPYLTSDAAKANDDLAVKEALKENNIQAGQAGGQGLNTVSPASNPPAMSPKLKQLHAATQEQSLLRMKLAQMVFQTNLPDEWLEHPCVIEFFHLLRPDFFLLTAQELRNMRLKLTVPSAEPTAPEAPQI